MSRRKNKKNYLDIANQIQSKESKNVGEADLSYQKQNDDNGEMSYQNKDTASSDDHYSKYDFVNNEMTLSSDYINDALNEYRGDKVPNIQEDILYNIPDKVSDNQDGISYNIPNASSDNVLNDYSDNIPIDTLNNITGSIPDNISNNITGSIPDNSLDGISANTLDDISASTLDGIPEYISENSIYDNESVNLYDVGINANGFDETVETTENSKFQNDKKQDESFGDFVHEYFHHVNGKIKNNKVPLIIFISAAAVVVLVIVAILILSKPKNDNLENLSVSETELAMQPTVSEDGLIVPQDECEVDAYPEVNALIEKYFSARQSCDVETLNNIMHNIDSVEIAKYEVLCKYIEQYTLRNCYTKKGPYDNSYIVYAIYDVKMSEFDVLAPGLQTFIVCSDDTGSLYIYSGDFDSNITDYINEISSQQDVVDLMQRISVEYNDILASNEEFSEYMSNFKVLIKSEIGDKLADIDDSSSDNSSSDNSVSSDGAEEVANEVANDEEVSDNNANTSETDQSVTKKVKATTTVNVRASDSENADKLGKVEAGSILNCTCMKSNGWSEIEFEGQKGFVKTEYVEEIDEDSQETGTVETKTSIMLNDTVKVRESDSTDSESLGVAYAGQTFDLINKQDNGWTKILFNGKEGFVKSEYVLE